MIKKLKSFAKTDLIKTSFFTSIATIVKIATAFVLNKVVAVYVGPVGVALIGQFTNFFGIIITIGSGGINNGIIKYIAENRDNETNTRKIISTSFWLMVLCSLISGLILFLFADYFTILLFKSQEYKFVLNLISLSLLFASLNSLLMSILNGHKEVKKYTSANIITSLLILVLSILLVASYKLQGVLIALVAGQSLVFFITLLFVLRCHWFKVSYFFRYLDKGILKNLSKYSIMTIVSSLTGPVALLIIRNYIGTNLSWEAAGYWQGVYSISDVYLMFITTSLGVYYLPRISEIKEPKELRQEILSTSKIVLPIAALMAFVVYLCRIPLTLLLFTVGFKPMLSLFKYQLLGDVIKLACWLISFQMIAKSMTKLFIFTEMLFSLSFVVLAIFLINFFGLEGTTIAFCINYSLYFIFLIIYFRKQLFQT